MGQIVWTWTFGGLPGWLVLPGFSRNWSQLQTLNQWPIKAGDLPNGPLLDLILGPELLLEKRLTLPVAARSNLSKVIDLNMRQSLPAGGVDLLWRHGTGKRNGSILDIPIYLLKKSTLSEIQSFAASQGANVRSISVAGDTSAHPFWHDIKRTDRLCRFWGITTVGLVVALIALFAWNEFGETRSLKAQIILLEEKRSILSRQAVEMRTKLDAESTSFAAISSDLEMLNAEYHRLPILLGLAETLSDETWISELAIRGSELYLSGFTGHDVTKVMSSLRELPWVRRVDLDGPVSFDSFSRRNRFDMSIRLRPEAGSRT